MLFLIVQPLLQSTHALQKCDPIRRDELSRDRGCRSAQIGGKIAERKIGFMANGADNRHGRCSDGAGQLLVIEGPEVFQ